MKKDYSKNNIINIFCLCLPNVISYIISILITLFILLLTGLIHNKLISMVIFGFVLSFIGLPIGGILLNKYCINKDLNKCKKCKNWNCNRI